MGNGVFLEDWADSGADGMFKDFSVSGAERELIEAGFEVLHAFYCYEDYSGLALVVLRSRSDGELWEVNGSHCSCHGLEDQWEMESTTFEALERRNAARALPGLGAGGMSKLAAMMEARELGKELAAGRRPPRRSI